MSGSPRLRRHRGFRLFWAASTVSAFGTYLTALAVGVLVVTDLGGDALDVGIVQAAAVAPYLLGLFAGVLADRVRRRPLLVATDLASAVVLAVVPLLAWSGVLTIPALAALVAAAGLSGMLNAAAFQSFLPRLLPRERLPRANARIQQSDAVAQTSGPLLAGGLVALVGAPLTVLVDAASFAVSALLVAMTPVVDPAPAHVRRPVLAELREGTRWVYRHPGLRPVALTDHLWFLVSGVFRAAYVPFALRELHLGAAGLGVTFALAGLGGLVGGLASEAVGRRLGVATTMGGARVLEAVGVGVVAAAAAVGAPAVVVVAAAGQLLMGLGLGAENPVEMAYRQSVTPDRLQGRMNATIRSVNRVAVVVGAPLGGLLADAVGLLPALLVTAAGVAVSGVALLCSGPARSDPPDRTSGASSDP